MRIKRDEFWHFKNGPNRILAWEIFRNRYILLLSLYTRARARAKIIIREVSIRKVKPQKDARRMHAAASSSSILGLMSAYKQSANLNFICGSFAAARKGGGGDRERERDNFSTFWKFVQTVFCLFSKYASLGRFKASVFMKFRIWFLSRICDRFTKLKTRFWKSILNLAQSYKITFSRELRIILNSRENVIL